MNASCVRRRAVFLLAGLLAFALASSAQQAKRSRPNRISEDDLSRMQQMLDGIYAVIKDRYYDPTFHGIALKPRLQEYQARLADAPDLGAANRVIAAFVAGLHDSHTYYMPPRGSFDFFYGFRMQMIGGRCFVTHVRPGSDAALRVHPGDQVLRVEGYSVNAQDFGDLTYDLYTLEPRGGLHLDLRSPDGAMRSVVVMTKFVRHSGFGPSTAEAQQIETLYKDRHQTVGSVFIWKIPEFAPEGISAKAWKQAQQAPAIVLDLRGNPGGELDSLEHLAGYFLPDKTLIARVSGRDQHKPLRVSSHHPPYAGKLVVLVDSESASAAELLARVLQLEHRATIVGSQSAGAVMESNIIPVVAKFGGVCGVSVTIADLIMGDGKSLEKVGVTPDVVVDPTAADLAAGNDPALAAAVRLAGGSLDPSDAGRLFPFLWPPYKMSA